MVAISTCSRRAGVPPPFVGVKGRCEAALRSASRWGCAPPLTPLRAAAMALPWIGCPGLAPLGPASDPLDTTGRTRVMDELMGFLPEITLTTDEVLDLVTSCDEIMEQAGAFGALETAFAAEGMKRLLLGRLMGLDEG